MKRKMQNLTWRDIGKHITFISTQGRTVSGDVRSITHGIYSNQRLGERDVPRVLVGIYRDGTEQAVTPSRHESHWATPETRAEVGLTEKNTEKEMNR